MNKFLLFVTLSIFTGCGQSPVYDDYTDSSYSYYEDAVDYSSPRQVDLDEVDGDYAYGTDENGDNVEIEIQEWYDSGSGYGQDVDGNEVEFNYY